MTAINLGRGSPTRLGATYPPTQRNHLNVGLLGIAARRDCPFHPALEFPQAPTRLCCSDPHLTVERCYLLRCPVQSGRSSSAGFPPQRLALLPVAASFELHQRRSGVLHDLIIDGFYDGLKPRIKQNQITYACKIFGVARDQCELMGQSSRGNHRVLGAARRSVFL